MMRTVINPSREVWPELCKRPATKQNGVDEAVRGILENVRTSGDRALTDYSIRFDNVEPKSFKIRAEEIVSSAENVPSAVKDAICCAAGNIRKFHLSQTVKENPVETVPGVLCRRKSVPIEKVGFYIPAGTAPLLSTVLMLGIPAGIAGCRQIVLCTPPVTGGSVDPLILFTAGLCGIKDIFCIGGAQAIAAMAYGTESVPRVDKIFGPGNQYVTRAKELVQAEGTAVDLPAGPSEVLVIADKNAYPAFVAADLISQAEHGTDSQVILATDSIDFAACVIKEIDKQMKSLPRKDIAWQSLEKSIIIKLPDLEQCLEFSNFYSPEHLIINTPDAAYLSEKVTCAGSVFIGEFSCESAGDYASGTNHVLPTNGYAKSYSGVSVDSFVRKITFQEITREGIQNLGPVIMPLASAELLQGHSNAVKLRLENIRND